MPSTHFLLPIVNRNPTEGKMFVLQLWGQRSRGTRRVAVIRGRLMLDLDPAPGKVAWRRVEESAPRESENQE